MVHPSTTVVVMTAGQSRSTATEQRPDPDDITVCLRKWANNLNAGSVARQVATAMSYSLGRRWQPSGGDSTPDPRLAAAPPLPVSLLLHGPPGAGKTRLARSLCTAVAGTGTFKYVMCADVFSATKAVAGLRALFRDGQQCQTPHLLVLDEVDTLCPAGGGALGRGSSVEALMAAELRECLQEAASTASGHRMFVIGVTARRDSVSEEVLRAGLFHLEVHMDVPTAPERLEVLQNVAQRLPLGDTEERQATLAAVAGNTHGFVAADLVSLCRVVGLHAARAWQASREPAKVSRSHFEAALAHVRPSILAARRTDFTQSASLQDLAGLGKAMDEVTGTLLPMLRNPGVCTAAGCPLPGGVVFWGPSGTGKTSLAVALAREAGLNVISVQGTDLRSKVIGESEALLTKLFDEARACRPCLLLIDQLEVLASRRTDGADEGVSGRLLACLLQELDRGHATAMLPPACLLGEGEAPGGAYGLTAPATGLGVFVIGTAERLSLLDPAVLQTGRMDYTVHVPLPDMRARGEIIKHVLSSMPSALILKDSKVVAKAAGATQGWSSARLANTCREAAMQALRDDMTADTVDLHHFATAFGIDSL